MMKKKSLGGAHHLDIYMIATLHEVVSLSRHLGGDDCRAWPVRPERICAAIIKYHENHIPR